jgi:hypothetical protein
MNVDVGVDVYSGVMQLGWFLMLQNLSSMQQLCSCLYGNNMNAYVKTEYSE